MSRPGTPPQIAAQYFCTLDLARISSQSSVYAYDGLCEIFFLLSCSTPRQTAQLIRDAAAAAAEFHAHTAIIVSVTVEHGTARPIPPPANRLLADNE